MKILILGAGPFQQPVIKRANQLGHSTLVADSNPDAPGMRDAELAVPISSTDTLALLKLAEEQKIDGVLTTSDYPVKSVARISEYLGLRGLTVNAAEICTNKFRQREVLKRFDLPTPDYHRLQPSDEPPKSLKFPVIVKPIDSSASRGVSKVLDLGDLNVAVEYARSFSKLGEVIIEEYLEGQEFSVEVLVQEEPHIIAITQKITSGDQGKFFVEECHVVPAILESSQDAMIRECVTEAIRAAGITHAACHIEVMVKNSAAFIIEIAARLGGDYITSHLVPLATGVDMLEAIINISLGLPIKSDVTLDRFAGVRFLTPKNYNLSIKKINSLKGDKDLITFDHNPNCDSEVLRTSFDRLGYWICCSDDRQTLIEKLSY